jgi:2-methylisocitrate lyase-like PEP mutase family enzyme
LHASARLRALLDAGDLPVVAPGAYDALSALAAEAAGFPAVYLGGFATSGALGVMEPVMTMTEQVGIARRIAERVAIPLLVDGHTGYGTEVHIARTVREFERAGVAGIHLEDQAFPKRASYHKGVKGMVSVEEMRERLETALEARADGLFIIARTEAWGIDGSIDEVIDRLGRYAEAGADALMPMVNGDDAAVEIRRQLPDATLLWTSGLGRFAPGPEVAVSRLAELRYELVISPLMGLVRAIEAVARTYDDFKASGLVDLDGLDEGYERVMRLIGAHAAYAMEDRATAPTETRSSR